MSPDWDLMAWLKALGASIGSGIAILFRPSRDGKTLVLRLFIGVWVGYLGSSALVSYLELEPTSDTILLASSFLGIVGYSAVGLLLSPDLKQAILARVRGSKEAKE